MAQSNEEVFTKSVLKPPESRGNLASYFANAYNDDHDVQSDFILISEEGSTIKTHKVILASRYRIFRGYFRDNPSADSFEVPIKYSILKKCVDSLYSRVDLSPEDTEALKVAGIELERICAVSRDWKLQAKTFDSITIALSVIINVMMKVVNGPDSPISCEETITFLREKVFIDEASLNEDNVNDTLMTFLRHSTFSENMKNKDVVDTVLKSHTFEHILNTSAKINRSSLAHSILSSLSVSRPLSNFTSLMPSCLVENIDPFVVVDTKCSRMFGSQPGQENLTGSLHLGIIKEITICTRRWSNRDVVKGLKILFQNNESLEIGLDDKQPKETKTFNLHDDEYISYAKGGAGFVLDSLAFVTNKGRQFGPLGGDGGGEFCTLTCRHRKLLKENRNSARVVLRGIAALEGYDENESIMTHLQFVTTVMCNRGEEELWDDAVL